MDTEPEVTPVADEGNPQAAEPEFLEQEAETTESPEGETDGEIDELEKLLGEPETGEPELVEIEIDGKKIKVSQEGKDYLLRQQDYTKKTMELAEQRKAAESERAVLESFRNLSNERMQAVQNILTLDQQIEQISNTPIDGLSETDIIRLRQDLTDLQNQRTQWAGYGQQIAQREQAERDQQFAKARETAIREASLRIPNFTDARRTELETLAVSLGANQADVTNIADPAVYEVLHWADIGRKYAERQKKAVSIKDAAAVKPAPEVGTKAAAGKNPDNMSMEEWVKWREKRAAQS